VDGPYIGSDFLEPDEFAAEEVADVIQRAFHRMPPLVLTLRTSK
jgi:hypothetical protein